MIFENVWQAPSMRPSDWSVDDLCWMLEQRGLANCCDRSS
jgi:hypothetical protein